MMRILFFLTALLYAGLAWAQWEDVPYDRCAEPRDCTKWREKRIRKNKTTVAWCCLDPSEVCNEGETDLKGTDALTFKTHENWCEMRNTFCKESDKLFISRLCNRGACDHECDEDPVACLTDASLRTSCLIYPGAEPVLQLRPDGNVSPEWVAWLHASFDPMAFNPSSYVGCHDEFHEAYDRAMSALNCSDSCTAHQCDIFESLGDDLSWYIVLMKEMYSLKAIVPLLEPMGQLAQDTSAALALVQDKVGRMESVSVETAPKCS